MKSFQKGLLLGIGMTVVCGTFVASKSLDKKSYTVSKLTDGEGYYQRDQIEFTNYVKVMNGENNNLDNKKMGLNNLFYFWEKTICLILYYYILYIDNYKIKIKNI